ncbi:hypothetical protein KAF25_003785 [Fusarium avenaceum]|uniref:PiggyBac transposable element-derived protein domain-containing protein n=1 Tax=Fusarium avenaceum TaxID=40199 RepID=A0A9P7H1T1_9HYPO|nr:hypothetical protein KAF25_003785 [Fusarium avenaceum]
MSTNPSLIRALRERGIAATGPARTNQVANANLVTAKEADRAGRLQWSSNSLPAVPSEDSLVNQLASKDNCVVLWMASHSSGSQRAQDLRRPNTSPTQARKAPARVMDTPSIQVVYNFKMNGADRGDQLRAHRGYDHRIRGDRWQALAWSFLLDTLLINTTSYS